MKGRERRIDRLTLRQRVGLEMERTLRRARVEEHPLRQLFWESTLRCNLSCRHCGSDCRKEAQHPDMPLKDFLRVLDRISEKTDPHGVFVIVSGGEPLMRSDIEECGREIYGRGFPWGMVTNGMALTERRFDALLRAGLHSMTVSVDGFEEEHNWMRGNGLSFQRAVEAVKMALRVPEMAFDVVTCVNRRNYEQMRQLRDYLYGIGLRRWRVFTVFPAGRAATDGEMTLDGEQTRGLMEFIKETRKEGRMNLSFSCEGFLGAYEGEVREHLFGCEAGVSIASVLIDGSISACTSIRANYHQGNIYEDDFWEVWQNGFREYRDREWMRKGVCGDCRFFRYCLGNGMHLRDDEGRLTQCLLKRMTGERCSDV